MRIGIDLDNVIFDHVGEVLRRWNRQHGTSFKYEDMTQYEFYRCMDISYKEYREWYEGEAAEEGILADLPPYPDAETFLWELTAYQPDPVNPDYIIPNTIIFITARDCQLAGCDTVWSLNNLGVPYDELHFCEDKWRVDCDVYIDDNPNLIRRFNKLGKELIVPTRPWTQYVSGTMDDYKQIVARLSTLCQREYGNGY